MFNLNISIFCHNELEDPEKCLYRRFYMQADIIRYMFFLLISDRYPISISDRDTPTNHPVGDRDMLTSIKSRITPDQLTFDPKRRQRQIRG